MYVRTLDNRRAHQLACNVCIASASALLIQISHTYQQLWFVAFFALIPFLWRAIAVSVRGSAELGCTLAVLLWLSALLGPRQAATAAPFMQLLLGCGVFVGYALAVNRLGRWLGCNAVFIALLWLPVEQTLHMIHLPVIVQLERFETGSPFLTLASLFGVLMVSFAIVLINSLVLVVLRYVAEVFGARDTTSGPEARRPYPYFRRIVIGRLWHNCPDARAPPNHATSR